MQIAKSRLRSFVSHLESALDGTRLEAGVEQTVHAGRPVWVRYDLDAAGRAVRREDLAARPETMWRYCELLPLPVDATFAPYNIASTQAETPASRLVSLGETMTPVISAERLAREIGVGEVLIKDESRLPTGSFKARGMAVAVNVAWRFGRRRFAAPSNGNAGGAMAAYVAAARGESWVFMPRDTPAPNVAECVLAGAHAILVDGQITDCGRIVRELAPRMDWFDLSTLREPYRIEGKKTMGLELAEQLGWALPDVIFYPTGGGTGLIGMWKAFAELRALGWLASARLPRMVVVQSDGCAPLVRAWESGARFAEPWPDAQSAAFGIRVPAALGDFMILDAVRESGGCAVAVRDGEIPAWQRRLARATGLSICPEAGACLGALLDMRQRGLIRDRERVVLFNTAGAAKYDAVLPADLPVLDPRGDIPRQFANIVGGRG